LWGRIIRCRVEIAGNGRAIARILPLGNALWVQRSSGWFGSKAAARDLFKGSSIKGATVDYLWPALALLLVLEGLWPSLAPASMRRMLLSIAQMDDRSLRISGLISIFSGLALSFFVI